MLTSKYFHIENVENNYARNLIVPSRKNFIRLKLKNLDENFPLNNFDITSRTCFLPDKFVYILDKFYELEAKKDDVWIVTYPKSGTTWIQEMIWLIQNNFDFETALNIELTERSPFLEFSGFSTKTEIDSTKKVEQLYSPRLIKSHMPASFLPKSIWKIKPKIIYVSRNPKDACISYYYHWKGMINYQGSKDEFVKAFITDNMNFAPYWDHIKEFNQLKDIENNILFLTYEEMKLNLKDVILKCCKFLDKNINSEQLDKLNEHLSFENMKNNPRVNHSNEIKLLKGVDNDDFQMKEKSFQFFRKGEVGSHKDELSDELTIEFDNWIIKNIFK